SDKLPLAEEDLLDLEMLSILSDATEKTQKPFLKRALHEYFRVKKKGSALEYFKRILQNQIREILGMSGQDVAKDLMSFMQQIVNETNANVQQKVLTEYLGWHGKMKKYYRKKPETYFDANKVEIEKTDIYITAGKFEFPENILEK